VRIARRHSRHLLRNGSQCLREIDLAKFSILDRAGVCIHATDRTKSESKGDYLADLDAALPVYFMG